MTPTTSTASPHPDASREPAGGGRALPKIIEAADCMGLGPSGADFALTCEWPDGTETLEHVSEHAARALGYDPDDEGNPREDPSFDRWIRTLDEDVIQGDHGYELGEFTVFPEHWRAMFDEGLTPAEAFRRALDAHAQGRRENEADRKANWARIQAEDAALARALPSPGPAGADGAAAGGGADRG